MKQITLATTLFGAMTAAAAISDNQLGDGIGERVLLVANNAPVPEVVDRMLDIPGAAEVASRFDRVVDLNDLIHPQHPSQWRVEDIDAPAWERMLRQQWDLGDGELQLVVESIHVPPAATLLAIFPDATVIVLSEGLMSYGATRDPQTHAFGQRIQSLVHLDLLPGVSPVLLSEFGVTTVPVSTSTFGDLVSVMAGHVRDSIEAQVPVSDQPTALILGQYLAALGLVSHTEEASLQARMIKRASDAGATRVIFKPHPSAPPADVEAITAAAAAQGVDLVVLRSSASAEVVLAIVPCVIVVACFSTALVTAHALYGVEAASVGADLMLERLKPFQNSNRIPATVIDARARAGSAGVDAATMSSLVLAVAFAMQPKTLANRRDEVVEIVGAMDAGTRRRYIKQRRLNSLNLPGQKERSRAFLAARSVGDRLPVSMQSGLRAVYSKARNVKSGQAGASTDGASDLFN